MEPKPSPSPLSWVLRRPLARPGSVLAILGLSACMAPLRVATIAALLPVLKLILHEDGGEQLRAAAADTAAWIEPLATAAVGFATDGSALRALAWTMAAMLSLAVIRGLLMMLQEGVAARLVHQSAQDVAIEVHDALLRGAGDERPEGSVLTHFSADLDAVRAALRRVYVRVLREPLHLLAALGFLLWIDWRLALWTGVAFPAAAAVLLTLSRRLRHLSRRSLARTGSVLSVVEECLRGRRVVRSFGLEQRERERFSESFDSLTSNLVKLDRQEAISSPLLEILALIAAAACTLLGVRQVVAGELSAEGFLTFYAVLLSVLDPLRKLADTQVRIQRGNAAAQRLHELVHRTPPPAPVRGVRDFPPLRAGIEVRGLGVRTADGSVLLNGVDLELRPGDALLVAGESGAGKSTLLDVLGGLRPASEGAVDYEGVPLKELDPSQFRRRVALVAQQTFLFRGSIRENVTLGDPEHGVSLEEALDQAGLSERLGRLEHGVETLVEDVSFSAGERQRLSLARALYRDPAVLLLDEATSALDRPREESILRHVLGAREDRITVLVTHRLHRDLPVDRVLILERGRAVASGGPDELRRSSQLYRALAGEEPTG